MSTQPAPAAKTQSTAPEDRVPFGQKLGYGLGAFHDMWGHWLYPTFAYQVFNIFLGVAPWLVSTALLINRVFDAVSDPFFGWLSDNTRSRFGRRRPFILIGGILAGIGLPILVGVAPGWSEMQYFWFMLISSALFIPIMSCFNMPWVSLGSELTPDYHERTSVMSFQRAIQKVPEVFMFFAAQFTTMAVWVGASYANLPERLQQLLSGGDAWKAAPEGTKPNILLAAQVYCTVLGAILVVCAIIIFFSVRERYYGKLVSKTQQRIKLSESLWQTLQCRPFRIQLTMKLAYAIGTSMVGALGYYATVYYVCKGDLGEGAKWNTLMGFSGMVFGFIGVPTFAYIARRLGKRHCLFLVLGLAILIFLATWWLYTPSIRWLQLIACGLIAFTGVGFWMMDGSMTADIIDYDELETGKRREGAIWSCGSWIMKAGIALGAGASGWILSATGFKAELGGNQAEYSLFMIRLLLAIIPALGLVIALVALARFPLTQERMAEIRAQLEARRGKV